MLKILFIFFGMSLQVLAVPAIEPKQAEKSITIRPSDTQTCDPEQETKMLETFY